MKDCFIFVVFLLFGINAYPQNSQKILVLGEDGPLCSAHLLYGDKVIAVSDSSGHFYYDKTNVHEKKLRITHLLYDGVTFDTPTADTLVHMQTCDDVIEESVFYEDNQWSVLKKKLKEGLSLHHTLKALTVTSQDTLIRNASEARLTVKGTILFYLHTKKPLVKVKTIQDDKGENYRFSNKKEKKVWTDWMETSIGETFGNAMYYAHLLFLPQPREGLFITHKGYSGGCDIFDFYLPPAAENGKARFKGTAYIQSDSGILAQLEVKLVPLKPNVSTLYDVNIQYTYDERTNTVLPTKLSGEAYHLDKDLNITMTRKSVRMIDFIR